ncbi:DNA-processing protein DprA [Halalkalibacter oceani]|uniref:DNA-processing protein DprA n=1 Tax=Halalkalibacter oceani TaxID=1653776 RepID=UPI0033909E68
MTTFRMKWIHLHSCFGANRKLFQKIIDDDPELHFIYQYRPVDLEKVFTLPPTKAMMLHQTLHRISPAQLEQLFQEQGICPITLHDSTYPCLLQHIYDPPFVLYTQGLQHILANKRTVAVVGTRKPTEAGMKSAAYFVHALVENDWTIVSGLASGIDAHAHQQAIRTNGRTIAVLASGFHFPYPQESKSLFQYMAKWQLLVSEYPPWVRPRKWHFPVRNRIVSGLSQAVVVIEAKKKSGSLITADQALEQGRDVFAVPGSIFSAESEGTNRLIQQGAKLILTKEDLLQELPNVTGKS